MFSLFVPENSELPTRRAHKKSRNGCVTCKQRKLKCGEVKPVCGNCNRRFLTIEACDYGSGAVFRRRHTAKFMTPRTNEVTPAQSSQSTSTIADENPLMNLVLPGSIAGELLDPFKTHPESKVQGIDMLMKYYLSKAVYKSYPWQPPSKTNPTTTYYVPLVWSDPVLFHATLQMSCLRLDKEKKQGCGTLAFGLLGESLRLLRLRVEEEEERERGVSDQTISAVATLAAIEHEKGNIARLRMHMNGLQRMISIRGGLNNIRETNPMVANSVFWMFIVASYELPFPNLDPNLAPITPTTTSTSDTQHLTSYFDDLLPPLPSPLLQSTPTSTPTPNPNPATSLSFDTLGLHPSISQILLSVQHVSLTVTKSSSYPTASNSLAILTRLMTLLSHLMSILSVKADTEYSCLISECVRYAILLHIFTPWRGLPPDETLAINSLLHSILRVLKRLLALPSTENSNGLPLHNKNNILVLWILAVGGVSASGLPERTWFVRHLVEMSDAMGVVSCEDMKACVSRVVWHEMLCALLHRKLWDEVVEMKEWLAREEL